MTGVRWIVGVVLMASGCGPEPSIRVQASPPVASPPAVEPAAKAPVGQEVSRADAWAPPVPLREWEFIVLHHTATDEGDVAVIHQEHQKRKDSAGVAWRGIGYHFLIGNGKGMADGAVEPTFRWTEQAEGAHAGSLKHNERGIGVCLVGNFNKTAPTKKQLASLKRLMEWLKAETGIPEERVLKHSDIKTTACPGKKFRRS
jgi:N-acetyl-anhydromuramyl-L-alanine amidase AmpD